MNIHFECGRCRSTHRAKAEHAGRRAKCPKCGQILMIPRAGGVSRGESPARPVQTPVANTASSPMRPCAFCGALAPVDASCPHCGHKPQMPQHDANSSVPCGVVDAMEMDDKTIEVVKNPNGRFSLFIRRSIFGIPRKTQEIDLSRFVSMRTYDREIDTTSKCWHGSSLGYFISQLLFECLIRLLHSSRSYSAVVFVSETGPSFTLKLGSGAKTSKLTRMISNATGMPVKHDLTTQKEWL
jgi:hypothetical protein